MSDSEITELLNELSTPKNNQIKRHRSQVQEMPLLTEEQDSPQNLLLRRKYEHLLKQYLDLKKKLDEHNFQKQVVLAQVKNDQEQDVFYSLESQKKEFYQKSSPKKIFLPLKKIEVPKSLIFSQASRKSDYQKGNSIPYCSELFHQIDSLMPRPHFTQFKDFVIQKSGVIFHNNQITIQIQISEIKINKIEKNLKFLDLQDYSDSTLHRSVYPSRFEDLVPQALYRQKASIIVKQIPFTFLEITGEYDDNVHFKIVLPITILNFSQFSKDFVCQGECVKLSIYNYNASRLRQFLEVFQLERSFGVKIFEEQQIVIKLFEKNGKKLKVICFTNGNTSAGQQFMNTMYFLFSN